MITKATLPIFWETATGGIYPASAVTLRMRILSEVGLLPPRRTPLTDQHKALFLIGLYASSSHVGAVDAAKRIADLANPSIELGQGLAWNVMNGRFEDVLTQIIHDCRLSQGGNLLEVAICSTHPEAMIAVSGWVESKYVEEAYRFFPGQPRGRFGRPSYDERHISGTAISALALHGATDTTNENGALPGAPRTRIQDHDLAIPAGHAPEFTRERERVQASLSRNPGSSSNRHRKDPHCGRTTDLAARPGS